MENMDNNMDDFFKKRLNSFDKPIEDWAKPDPEDWDKAMSQIPMFNQTSFWTLTNIGIIGLGAVLMGSILYILHLKQEVTILEKNVSVQYEKIEQVERSIQTIDEKYAKEQTTLQAENEVLKQQNEVIITQNQQLKTIVHHHQQTISTLYKQDKKETTRVLKSNTEFKNNNTLQSVGKAESTKQLPIGTDENKGQSIIDKTTKPIAAHSNSNHSDNGQTDLQNRSHLTLKDSVQERMNSLEHWNLTALVADRKHRNLLDTEWGFVGERTSKKRRGFSLPRIDFSNGQVGYEYRLEALPIQTSLNIKELETSEEDDLKENAAIVNLHGLTLDLPIAKKWKIQMGVRYSNSVLGFKKGAYSIYKSKDEYSLKDGLVANNLSIEQATPFAKSNTSIQLIFEEFEKLEDNEGFEWYVEGKQEQRTIQLPLGLAYQLGGSRLNGIIGMGGQWNQIRLGDVNYTMKIADRAKDFEVFTADTEVLTGLKALNYWSAYGMLGVQYQLQDNWSLRASAAYNYHFLKKTKLENWSNNDKSIAIGLVFSY